MLFFAALYKSYKTRPQDERSLELIYALILQSIEIFPTVIKSTYLRDILIKLEYDMRAFDGFFY